MKSPAPPHGEEHEDLLHDHLAGDVPASDPRLVRLLATCSTCRTQLAELRSMTELLGRVGRDERRALAELPEAACLPGADLVAPTLRALAAGQAAPRPQPVPRRPQTASQPRATLWRVGLAAASVLAAGWLVKTLLPIDREPQRTDVLLGNNGTRSLVPHGTVASFERFTWKGLGTRAVRFELRIWSAEQPASDDPLLRLRLYTDHWVPTAQQDRDLPDSIYWEVTGYDDLGEACAFAGERAARSAR